MKMLMQLILMAVWINGSLGYIVRTPQYHWYGESTPLAVLDDRPVQVVSHQYRQVPLLAVDQHHLALIDRPHVSAVSSSSPYVTCQQDKRLVEALPAVRLVLDRPILMDGQVGSLPFPTRISVVHDGIRYTMPIGALIAPVHEPAYASPHFLNVLYAVPTQVSIRSPIAPPHSYYPDIPYLPFRPQVLNDPRPQVTVLNFPVEVATPSIATYPSEENKDDLNDRNPPERVVPAGIVQSAQPTPSIQQFVNSKESPLLQTLRDESKRNKIGSSTPGVEAL